VHLQVSSRNRSQENPPFVTPKLVDQSDAVTIGKVQVRRIFRIHKNRVALRPGQRIHLGVNQRIELLAATGAHFKNSGFTAQTGKRDRTEVSLAVGGGKFAISTKMRPAVLELVSAVLQTLDALVHRNDTGHLL